MTSTTGPNWNEKSVHLVKSTEEKIHYYTTLTSWMNLRQNLVKYSLAKALVIL